MPQRPVLRIVGAAACCAALTATAGCSGDAAPTAPTPAGPTPAGPTAAGPTAAGTAPTGAAATTCADLLRALPARVADQDRTGRPGATTAAWGDPPIRLRCGVPRPGGFDAVSVCTVVDGVGWFVDATGPAGGELVLTVVDRPVRVELRLPEQYLPPAAAMVDLAPAVKATLRRTSTCH